MNLPNKITIFRILLIPLFVELAIKHRSSLQLNTLYQYGAISVFCLAAVSDALDGLIARLSKQKTVLGTYLDPIADKLLLDTAIILLSIPSARAAGFPLWFVILVLSRDFILVGGAVLIHMINGALTVKPSFTGKGATLLQMLSVVSVLSEFSPWARYLWICAGVCTAVSAAEYLWAGARQLSNQPQPPAQQDKQ